MKKLNIKITEANRAKIEAALHAVNGKAVKHAYVDLGAIDWHVFHAEKKLDEIKLPKALHAGAVWAATSGMSYDNKRQGTRITLERKSSGWYLVKIERATITNDGDAVKLSLTHEQHYEAVKRLMAGVSIIGSGAGE